jgi:argininosuccinate lyase
MPESGNARPIWSKRQSGGPSSLTLAYCAGRDVAGRPPADLELAPYDLWTNRAHCRMLHRRGIIDAKVWHAIARGLDRLERDLAAGTFRLDPTLEDIHINTERYVARVAGETAAGAMHTARSRNDQSATDMRLWLRDRLLDRIEAAAGTVQALSAFARREAATLAPGWTHGQPAMPTTLGHWAAAHAWALARDTQALTALWPLLNQSPLGAAAGFGTSWPVDRALTARLLGFDAPLPNSLDAISTRWEVETRVGQALAVLMTHLSSLGQDLIFLSTPPRAAIRLSDAHVTGSSIMPNKRNPDFAEVTRARAASVHGLVQSLQSVGRGALSGYNRDTQWTKYWIMDLLWEAGAAPEVFTEVVHAMRPDRRRLSELATEGYSLAADLADRLARTRKLPFRRAYHIVAEAVAEADADNGVERSGWLRLKAINAILKREKVRPALTDAELADAGNPARVLAERRSLGGPAPADVRDQAARLRAAAAQALRWARERRRALDRARRMAGGASKSTRNAK